MPRKHLIPICIELVGITTVGTGIGLELALGGEIYFAVITVGSLLIASGGFIFAKIIHGERR